MDHVAIKHTPFNEPEMARDSVPIKTYHCICFNLLIATTQALSQLSRRSPPVRDHAFILPVQKLGEDQKLSGTAPLGIYTSILGLTEDAKAIVVRRQDGFEKRICWRCNRCNVVVGYEIASHDDANSTSGDRGMVLYLLPNGLLESSILQQDKHPKLTERDVPIGTQGIGIWECE